MDDLSPLLPLIEPITYQSPQTLFAPFADIAWNLLIDGSSCEHHYGTSRYSYILIDPFERYLYDKQSMDNDPLLLLRQRLLKYASDTCNTLPPFQGGLAGYLSYDLTHKYHPVPCSSVNDMDCPLVCMGFYDVMISFDHLQNTAYLVSTGWPEQNPIKRLKRARNRMQWLTQQLYSSITRPIFYEGISADDISSNFTQEGYLNAVKRAVEYIKEGDIFEVNLAQRFSAPFTNPEQSYALYQRLSQINPSPFSAFLNFGECKILSASPERFIRLENRCVETRPIKGTRARHVDPIQDKQHISELLNSEKDFAENIMIVDLMRNDLAKVCEDDSIIVTQLCAHEVYPTVHHLVSVIRGQLKVSKTAFDLLKAVFPGGSITGAPKIRAMQIIAELEPHCRGPYCGNLILLGFDGYMDSSILIRTFVLNKDKLTFHAGGAVVLDSDPKMEYEETLIKAYALQKALNKDPI